MSRDEPESHHTTRLGQCCRLGSTVGHHLCTIEARHGINLITVVLDALNGVEQDTGITGITSRMTNRLTRSNLIVVAVLTVRHGIGANHGKNGSLARVRRAQCDVVLVELGGSSIIAQISIDLTRYLVVPLVKDITAEGGTSRRILVTCDSSCQNNTGLVMG